jgi:hypothetical protein
MLHEDERVLKYREQSDIMQETHHPETGGNFDASVQAEFRGGISTPGGDAVAPGFGTPADRGILHG